MNRDRDAECLWQLNSKNRLSREEREGGEEEDQETGEERIVCFSCHAMLEVQVCACSATRCKNESQPKSKSPSIQKEEEREKWEGQGRESKAKDGVEGGKMQKETERKQVEWW